MAEVVTGSYFSVLGVRAEAGRLLSPEDDATPGAQAVALISRGLWMRQYAEDPAAIGATLRINGTPFTITGVVQGGFHGTSQPLSADVWFPVSMQPVVLPGLGKALTNRTARWLSLIARLKDSVTMQQAEAALNTIDAQLQLEHREIAIRDPAERWRRYLSVSRPQGISVPHLRRRVARAGIVLMALTGIVLLIACVNIANLLLARASGRQREIAVRLAMGASRRRVVRQLLTESAMLSLGGAVAGIIIAWAAMRWFGEWQTPFPGPWRYAIAPTINIRVLGFGMTIGVATGVLFGLAPALRAARTDVVSSLKVGAVNVATRSGNRLRNALVAGQAAVSMVLLVCCALLLQSARNLEGAGPGFDSSRQIVAAFDLISLSRTNRSNEQFLRELKQRFTALPGIADATWVSNLPATMNLQALRATLPEVDDSDRPIMGGRVDPSFFTTTGIPILQGREFRESDVSRALQPAIVNERLAALLWPRGNALGARIRLIEAAQIAECEAIGIAATTKYFSAGEDPQPYVYRPFRAGGLQVRMLLRTHGAPGPMLETIRAEAARVDPNLELRILETYDEMLAMTAWPTRFAAKLLGVLSLIGLALTAAGLYGVTSYSAARRVHEFGVRIAIGARSADIVRLVLRGAGSVVLTGILAGCLLAALFTRTLSVLLAGVTPSDPATYTGVAAFLLVVALAAALGPARRASRVDPVAGLR
jgi:predicted permease